MSKQKKKGTAFESATAAYFSERLGYQVERRTLSGINDRGDLAGVRTKDGRELVIECKDHRVYELAEWMREARREGVNAGTLGVVVFHAAGVGLGRMGDQYVLMGLSELCDLIGGD